jgi:ABC-type microcin C transport system permease subunit YejE
MKREWPFLALEVVLLAVLLQSNAPEVWFWFIALMVLLTWRSLALRSRLEQRRQAQAATAEPPPPPAA